MTNDLPDDERMTAAEFRSVGDFLGLTGEWLATHLEVTLRTIRSWQSGRHKIPDGVRQQMEAWEADTSTQVARLVESLLDVPEPTLLLPRADEDCSDTGWPARWWRHVAMRAAIEVPGLSIDHRA